MANNPDILISGLLGATGLNGKNAPPVQPTVAKNGVDGTGWLHYKPATNGVDGANATENGLQGFDGEQGGKAGSFELHVNNFILAASLSVQSIGGNAGNGGTGGNGANAGTGGNAGHNKKSYKGAPAMGGKGGNGSDSAKGGDGKDGGDGGPINISWHTANISTPVIATSIGGNGGTGGTSGIQGMGGKGGLNQDGTFQTSGDNGSYPAVPSSSGMGGTGSSNVYVKQI